MSALRKTTGGRSKTMSPRLLAIVALAAMALVAVGAVQAAPTLSIQVTDSKGSNITGTTVPAGTVATVSAYYVDSGGSGAQATLNVFYDGGSGLNLVATLYSGTVNSGDTVTESYMLTNVGTYEFRWTCTPASTVSSSGFSTNCPASYQQRCQVNTSPQNDVPEPLPAAGLTIGLLAFGLFVLRRKRQPGQTL
jgi:long-subunit fatty acid transport protein